MRVPLLHRALVLSVGLHVAVGGVAIRAGAKLFVEPEVPASDVWSGQAVEVDSVALPGEDAETAANPAAASPEPAEPEASPKETEPVATEPAREASLPAPTPVAPKVPPSPRKPVPAEGTPAPSSASSASAGGQLAAADAGGGTEAARGAFGTTGLPAGVRHLAYAFTRALPQASWGNQAWSELESGPVGKIEVTLEIDEEGKLGPLSYPDRAAADRQPLPIRQALERTMLLLRAGTFSLAPDQRKSGTERLRIEFFVRREAPSTEEDGEGRHLRAEGRIPGYETPRAGRPGKTYFVLNSGLRVEADVYLVE